MKNKVFISYAHKDMEAVSKIADVLENKIDCDLWFDKKLHGGEEYFSIIADRILDCEHFIFVVSPNSVVSDWCIKELEFAMSEKKKIIAVWLEDFSPPPRVRLVISNTHYLKNYELNENDFAKNMAEALHSSYYELFKGEAENKLSEMQSESEKYFISPDDKKRINLLLKAEENQDFLTCFEGENAVVLGLAYEMGVGVERNIVKADFYYHIAAYKGNLDGEYLMLSLGLSEGTVEKVSTINRMNELAEAGSMKALVYWGDEVYLGNWGMEANKTKAYKWFRIAADKGDPVAKYFLGYGYRKGETERKDYVIAWMYFSEAAQQNFPRAYRQIAFMYEKGELVEQDKDKAREYFKKAIDCGDLFTENFVGNMEYDEKNFETAYSCYLKAAKYVRENNLPKASPFYNLGWCYEHGHGVESNTEKAIELYLEGAAKRGGTNCKKRVVFLINELEDEAKKVEKLKEASTLDCRYAEYYLAKHYEKCADVKGEQNQTSLEWLEKGADKGCIYCIEELMSYYSWVFGAKKFESREKSINNFSLFFSLLDRSENSKILETFKEGSTLYQYYYVYGVELDIDVEGQKPDKAMALYYYKKCLESEYAYKYFLKVVNNGSKFAQREASVIYYSDVVHSEEILDLCFDCFDSAFAKSSDEERTKAAKALIEGYNLIIDFYHTQKNLHSQRAEKINKCKSRIAKLVEK
ncbi:MAG: toll/interleukin-1 receptor domain-containing protein [Clostridia bacterium]|nr:toll/interleukin-1 receptor domain-containing protein [Clostridia bacterium]